MADCVAPTYSILNINKSVGRTVTNKPKQIPYQITCRGKDVSSCIGWLVTTIKCIRVPIQAADKDSPVKFQEPNFLINGGVSKR